MVEQNIQKVAKKNSGRNYPGITRRNKKTTHYNLEIIMLRNAALVQASV